MRAVGLTPESFADDGSILAISVVSLGPKLLYIVPSALLFLPDGVVMEGRKLVYLKTELLTGSELIQLSETYPAECVDALSWFRVRAEETANLKTAASLHQALTSFVRFLDGRSLDFDGMDCRLLSGWMARLLYEGYTRKTALYYLKNLSSLYGKSVTEGIAPATDAFTQTRERLQRLPDLMFEPVPDGALLTKLRNLWHSAGKGSDRRQLGVDILMFAVLAGGLSFEEIINYKKDQYAGNDSALAGIVAKYSKPKNRYLFPLRQSERTPAQLVRELTALYKEALSSVGLKVSNPVEDTALELWSMAALGANLSPEVVAGCMRRLPRLNPIFAVCGRADVAGDEKERILAFVSRSIADNPLQWHAMQFRPHVGFESVMARLKHCSEEVKVDQIYYPCREISRRIGNRIRYDKRPVINGLLYFRCRVSDIVPIFRNIGDLAWGYRAGGREGRPYAVISDYEISRLQTAIGVFAPESELMPVGTIHLDKGDKLEVLGGIFCGKGARFDSETTLKQGADSGKTVYRLLLPDGNGFEWEVNIDPRMVRRVSDTRYQELLDNLES